MKHYLRMVVLFSSPAGLTAQELAVAKSLAPIRPEVVTTLPDSMGGWSGPSVVLDSRGRYYQADWNSQENRGRIFVFDAHGTFVRSFGGEGRGPGEYPSGVFALAIGPGDTLYAFERRNQYTVVNPTTYGYVRTVAHRGLEWHPVTIGASRFLATVRESVVVTREFPDGYPRVGLRIFSDTGGISTRPFGFPAKEPIGRMQPCIARDGTIWSAMGDVHLKSPNGPYEYRLEAWDTLGRRHQVLVRHPTYWSSTKNSRIPLYCDIDEKGLLWVFTLGVRGGDTIAKLGGGDAIQLEGRRGRPRKSLGFLFPGAWITWVEVIDLKRKMVIASQELTEGYAMGVGNHLAFTRREDENGETSVAIVRFRLGQETIRK